MSEQITITLPDGSTKQVAAGTTPGGVAAEIGSRLGEGRHRGQGRRRVVGPRPARRPRRALSRSSSPASDEGREVLRHSTAHVHGRGGHPPLPGREVLDRPGDRRRLLLRLRPAGRPDVHRGRPRQDRGRDARDREGRPGVRARRGRLRRRARGVRGPAVQAGDHREGPRRRRERRRCGRGRRRRRRVPLPQRRRRARRVHRPVPRPARPDRPASSARSS